MSELLSKKRGTRNVYIRHTQNLINEIKELINNFDQSKPRHREKLKGLRYSLDDKMTHVKRLDDEIFELLDQEEAENDLTNCLVRNDEVFELIAAIEEKLIEKKETPINTDSSENISSNTEQIKCKLSKLVVKEFDGNVLNWQTFWNQFKSTIHSKVNINNIDQFGYLKSFLCPSACETISGFALTNQNYLEAVELLKRRYGNPQLLINTYMEQLVKLEKIEKSNDVSKLRTFFNKTEITVRNLKLLSIETSSYGSLLIPVLTSKLPTDLRTLFARKFTANIWLLDKLLVILKNKLEVKEGSVSPRDKQRAEFSRYRSTTSSFHTGSEFIKSNSVFCSANNHNSNRCAKVTDPSARKQIVFQKNLYYICICLKHKALN